jgi:hypothetical protein
MARTLLVAAFPVLLALYGGALGLMLSVGLLRTLVRLVPADLPRLSQPQLIATFSSSL